MKFRAPGMPVPQGTGQPLKKLLLVMKLSTFLITIALVQASAKGFSQITLHEKNAPFEKVMNEINQQSGYGVLYNKNALTVGTITVDLNNVSVERALEACLKNLPVDYKIVDKNVLLIPKAPSLIEKLKDQVEAVLAQIDVTGQVLDDTGQPLPGATVKLKDGSQATLTDANGYFALKHVDPKAVILVSFIGYSVKEISAKEDLGKIKMVKSADKLDEVQVIAYGETSIRTSTGDVTHISADIIDKQPVTNVLAAIEGRVPGLLIQQSSGLANAEYSMLIRGQSSIYSASVPLVIIDGIPFDPPINNLGAGSGASDGSALNYIDMSDIESIDVLKDAAATSIYGSRGANGVILITSRKGKAGDTKVTASFDQGMQRVATFQSFLNTQQYLQFRKQAFTNDGISTIPANQGYFDVDGTWDQNSYTDWQKLLIGNTAHYTDAKASVTGGTQTINYLVGVNYNRQSTIFPGDFSDQRGGLHFNLNSTSSNGKFKISLNGQFVTDHNNTISTDLSSLLNSLAPDAPSIYTTAGTLNWANSTWTNPYSYLLQTSQTGVNNLVSALKLSYSVFPGLDIKTDMGYKLMQLNSNAITPVASQDPALSPISTGTFISNVLSGFSIEPQITFKKAIKKNLIDAIIGGSIQQQSTNQINVIASKYSTDALLQSLSGAASYTAYSAAPSDYRYAALYARLHYSYDDRYIVDISDRRDGSSRFGPGKQFANFSSIGAAWVFTKESWLAKIPELDFGKITGSYGITGNDQIGNYNYLSLYNTTALPYEGTTGLVPAGLSNPDYTWEKDTKLKIGLDLGAFKDRIVFSASIYRQTSSNELLALPLPSFVGVNTVVANSSGKIQNEGLEISLTTTNVKTRDFNWRSTFNISSNRNTLLAYPGLAATNFANVYFIGHSLTTQKLFKGIGVNPQTGLYEFLAANGQTTNTPSYPTDANTFVDTTPKYFGGLDNIFSYKGFQLNFFLEFTKQIVGNPGIYDNPGNVTGENIPSYVWANMWHQPGDNAMFQKATSSYSSTAFAAWSDALQSTLARVDGSYIRLKTASISYTLSPKWARSIGMTNTKIYLQGQNLYTFSGLHEDPEVQTFTATGLMRTIVLGLQLNL